jgi:hypothetical protein
MARLELVRGPAHAYDLAVQKQFQDQVTAQWGNPAQFELLPHLLPPYFTLILAPLGWLPFRAAFVAWCVLTAVLVAAGVAALLAAGRITGWKAALFGLLAAAYLPTFVLLLQGQSDGLAMLGLGLSALAWTRGRQGWAGAAAALTLGKPQLVLLLPVLFFVRRSWRAAAAYLGVGAAAVAASFPFFGFQGWGDYLRLVAPWLFGRYPGFPVESQSLFSLRGALEHLPGGAGLALGVLALLLLLVAVALALNGSRPRLDFALSIAASIALSAYAHAHDLVLLLAPSLLLASLLLDGAASRPRVGWAVLGFSYLGVNLYLALGAVPAASGILALAAYLLSERVSLMPEAREAPPSSPPRRSWRWPGSTASAADRPLPRSSP